MARLNADPAVDGILVQLPLPAHIATRTVVEAVDPAKDVDGFHPLNVGLLASGHPGLVPCTPLGIMRLLAETGIALEGARALILGRSTIVGRPLAMLLMAANATVTVAHSRTRDLAAECRRRRLLKICRFAPSWSSLHGPIKKRCGKCSIGTVTTRRWPDSRKGSTPRSNPSILPAASSDSAPVARKTSTIPAYRD